MTETNEQRCERARERSRAWQLLSIAFDHPTPELHEQLAEGRFQQAFEQTLARAHGVRLGLPPLGIDRVDFEAQYIALFDTGPKGRPLAPLRAAAYERLLAGEPAPRLMHKYAQFYRHFGVQARTGHGDNALPDHLTCQLDCLAWLIHLEGRAQASGDATQSYRRAQHDFIERLLGPHCLELRARLSEACRQRGFDPFFAALAEAIERLLTPELSLLRSMLRASGPRPTAPAVVSGPVQNLWG